MQPLVDRIPSSEKLPEAVDVVIVGGGIVGGGGILGCPAATFVAGVFVLSPLHLEELSLSLVHTLFSISNSGFARQTPSGVRSKRSGQPHASPRW